MKKEKSKGMKMDKDNGKAELKKQEPKKMKGEKAEMKNADMDKAYCKYKKMKK